MYNYIYIEDVDECNICYNKKSKIILNASVAVSKHVVSVLIISVLKMNHDARLVDWSACFFKNSNVIAS